MAELGEEVWAGVKNKYWQLPVYFVPTCVMGGRDSVEQRQPQQQEQQQQQ